MEDQAKEVGAPFIRDCESKGRDACPYVELFITNLEVWEFYVNLKKWGWEAATQMTAIPEEDKERAIFFYKLQALDGKITKIQAEMHEKDVERQRAASRRSRKNGRANAGSKDRF